MMLRKSFLLVVFSMMMTTLAACDSAEERAEKHFQAGIELLQAGDTERAIVEFRNVFQLNEGHKEARMAFAGIEEDRGNLAGAYSQYLRVAEQYPDDIVAVTAVARIAGDQGNWVEARRYVDNGLKIVPDEPMLLAIKIGAEYAQGVETKDESARRTAAQRARALLKAQPDTLLLRRIVIDDLLRGQNFGAARDAIDAALVLAPKERDFYDLRLAVLSAQDDQDGIEAQLKDMITLFPGDPSMRATLVRWYVSRKEIDKAETFLRAGIDAADTDPAARVTLVSFLSQFRGQETALAELNTIIDLQAGSAGADDAEAAGNVALLRGMRASLLFDFGDRPAAIAEMEDVIATSEPSEETRNMKVSLARMLVLTGNPVGARALVEQVLAEDAGQVEALKIKAAWMVEDDTLTEAIALLRTALDQSPRDPQIMTLMALAYERSGDTELMNSMLSLAVEASNKAPQESIRYAASLANAGKYIPAESVLVDALRLDRENIAILAPLGQVYVAMADWPRAESVVTSLKGIGTPEAASIEKSLRTAILQGQQKLSETLDYLQSLVKDGTGGTDAQVAIVRTHMANGDIETARNYADEILAADPENPTLRFVNAAVKGAAGDRAGAETVFRALVAEDATRLPVWIALYRQLIGADRTDDAYAVLDQALVALPDAGDLLWLKAGNLEKGGDVDGAIAIYEKLYARDSSNAVIANNLASLLASYRNDPASLERAFVVARRLRGTTYAPFQDTYGWIVHLRGNSAEALDYLEPAAEGLPQDPLVQFHLATVYQALDRPDDALVQYGKVLALVPENDTRDFVATARTETASVKP